jgi:hypothetical protein
VQQVQQVQQAQQVQQVQQAQQEQAQQLAMNITISRRCCYALELYKVSATRAIVRQSESPKGASSKQVPRRGDFTCFAMQQVQRPITVLSVFRVPSERAQPKLR